jgi:hypothetical protein
MVVSEVFREPKPGAALAGHARLLRALQARIAEKLAVLDDTAVTGTDQSSAEALGVPRGVLAKTLAHHLVHEIMLRGSGGGPLAPLADQLNHDRTYLQGQQIEGGLPGSGSSAGLSSAASSPSTSGPRRSPGQDWWPRSGTPQPAGNPRAARSGQLHQHAAGSPEASQGHRPRTDPGHGRGAYALAALVPVGAGGADVPAPVEAAHSLIRPRANVAPPRWPAAWPSRPGPGPGRRPG